MSANNIENGLISESSQAAIEKWLAKYPADKRQSALIPALSIVQEQNGGWLDEPLMDAVALYLGLSKIAVYEVASFYSMFDLEKVGRNKIAVCNNISCMLCGADDIIKHIEDKLDIKMGESTADGRYTLKREEECLAACGGGPMMTVNGHYYEDLTTSKVDSILDDIAFCDERREDVEGRVCHEEGFRVSRHV